MAIGGVLVGVKVEVGRLNVSSGTETEQRDEYSDVRRALVL